MRMHPWMIWKPETFECVLTCEINQDMHEIKCFVYLLVQGKDEQYIKVFSQVLYDANDVLLSENRPL